MTKEEKRRHDAVMARQLKDLVIGYMHVRGEKKLIFTSFEWEGHTYDIAIGQRDYVDSSPIGEGDNNG